jgi:hypothetical protein
MTEWLRRAGRGWLGGDDLVLWSVAEGARGRRWRWVHQVDQGFTGHSGIVELLPDGRLGRLEVSSFGGLLTYHPEPDGLSAHGNIVTTDGVKPIATTWRSDWRVGIVGDPFASAIAGWNGFGFVVSWQPYSIVWREPGQHDDVTTLDCDGRGVPILEAAEEWALEE